MLQGSPRASRQKWIEVDGLSAEELLVVLLAHRQAAQGR